jgi:hypothetical protein
VRATATTAPAPIPASPQSKPLDLTTVTFSGDEVAPSVADVGCGEDGLKLTRAEAAGAATAPVTSTSANGLLSGRLTVMLSPLQCLSHAAPHFYQRRRGRTVILITASGPQFIVSPMRRSRGEAGDLLRSVAGLAAPALYRRAP